MLWMWLLWSCFWGSRLTSLKLYARGAERFMVVFFLSIYSLAYILDYNYSIHMHNVLLLIAEFFLVVKCLRYIATLDYTQAIIHFVFLILCVILFIYFVKKDV